MREPAGGPTGRPAAVRPTGRSAAVGPTGRPAAIGPTGCLTVRASWRATALTGLRGDVLDVGAGTGGSLDFLDRHTRPVLLEPHARSRRALARSTADRPNARVLAGRAENIPLDDASIDAVICSAVLCSVDDQRRALAEIHRVLRPAGRLVFLEHVAAPNGSWLRRGQRCYAPLSRLLDRGCHPARDTEHALADSPLTIVELDRFGVRGPFGSSIPLIAGVAVRAH